MTLLTYEYYKWLKYPARKIGEYASHVELVHSLTIRFCLLKSCSSHNYLNLPKLYNNTNVEKLKYYTKKIKL